MISQKTFPLTESALRWIEILFSERFGGAWRLEFFEERTVLHLVGAHGAIIFGRRIQSFSIPAFEHPCCFWDAMSEGWVSVCGDSLPVPGLANIASPLITKSEQSFYIEYDLPGLLFWKLCRLEEIANQNLDRHKRFSAINSHAFKFAYLDRPVVDEWMNILSQVISRQWPSVVLKKHSAEICLSHDVDRPSRYGFATPKTFTRRLLRDIANLNFQTVMAAPSIRLSSSRKLHRLDPYNTFDQIMTISERLGLKSCFNFICGYKITRFDADYDIRCPSIRKLMREIDSRGHEIGWHPSYTTIDNPGRLRFEIDLLRSVCEEEGISQEVKGVRMHYLRWRQPWPLPHLDDLGLKYDSTLGYADEPGFRCGTCFEYPVFDLHNSRILRIRERPLIAMDTSMLNPIYMNNHKGSPQKKILNLKRNCQAVEGQFTLLWHNSNFTNNEKSFEDILSQ